MVYGVNPTKATKVQGVSKDIKARIIVNRSEHSVLITMSAATPQAAQVAGDMAVQFGNVFAQQLNMFFKIQCEVVMVGDK